MDVRLGGLEGAVRERISKLGTARFVARLLAHDDTLWSDDPAHRKVAANRLGWLAAPSGLLARAPELTAFAAEVAGEGFTHAVLLGMGGSSLAPEVLRRTFGVAPGRLDLAVLDNTSPAAVRAITAAHDPRRTLFVVASKSGGTLEVTSFERHFWEWSRAVRGDATGRAFVAITDPGTSLGELARSRGYRRTFENPPDIGGRYSALSLFGLVPAALIGADVAGLLGTGAAELDALRAGGDAAAALVLGAAMGELARRGRDKLTLVLAPALASLGAWIEQLVAESTGKSGRGIVPVAGEPLATPDRYGDDRVFVAVGTPTPSDAAALEALARAGHPVLAFAASPAQLGAQFMRWEVATAVAGATLEVDPFDEPNVAEAKAATQAVLQRYLESGKLPDAPAAASDGALAAWAPAVQPALPPASAGWLEALAGLARPHDYLAVLAYLHATPARLAALESVRLALRERARLATTLGIGPRFLHSTGQLHKGGANNGVFLQLTADEGDLAIPGARYGFGVLRAAQAAGDYEVLERRGRRLVRIHLGSDPDAALATLAGDLARR